MGIGGLLRGGAVGRGPRAAGRGRPRVLPRTAAAWAAGRGPAHGSRAQAAGRGPWGGGGGGPRAAGRG